MPPLDVPGLRREWQVVSRANLAIFPRTRLPGPADVERAWNKLRKDSRDLNRSVFEVSAAMGVSALTSVPSHLQWLSRSVIIAARTTGMVVGGVFLDHYAAASAEIRKTGFADYCATHSRPHLLAMIRNFLPEKQSWKEKLLSGR